MAVKTFEINNYEVGRANRMTISGGDIQSYTYIICQSSDGYRFILYFFKPDSAMANNRYNPSAKVATAFLPAEQFKWYIQMLKKEKSIHAYLNSDNPINNCLYVGAELVGEEER